MPIIGRILSFAITVALAAGISACSGGEERPARANADTSGIAGDTLNPLGRLSVVDVLHSDERFSAFRSALDTVGLTSDLAQGGPYTVFVPTNQFFRGTAQALYGAQDQSRLLNVLQYHIVPGNLTAADLRNRDSLRAGTLEGTPVNIYRANGRFVVNGIPLVNTSVTVRNGTVYVLHGTLSPPGAAPTRTPEASVRRPPSQPTFQNTPQRPARNLPRRFTRPSPQETPESPPQETPEPSPQETPEPTPQP